jgi:hypothetical protein
VSISRLVWSSDPELAAQVVPITVKGRPRGHLSGKERKRLRPLLEGQLCAYCPAPATTWDHWIPKSKGGRLTPDNRVPACEPCNVRKADKDPAEWLQILAGPAQRSASYKPMAAARPVCPACGWVIHGLMPRERRPDRIRRTQVFEWDGERRVQQFSTVGAWCPECGFEMVGTQMTHLWVVQEAQVRLPPEVTARSDGVSQPGGGVRV